MPKLYNHQTSSLSSIDLRMIRSVPSGGNWKNIPKSIPSERIKKIRLTGGRTTYYGRLRWDKPSYTITCMGEFYHPLHARRLSGAELKRLGTFPDEFEFIGKVSAVQKRVGNCVPPNFMRAIASHIYHEILQKIK